MRNSRRKRKPSPLQVWKARYSYLCSVIFELKKAIKCGRRIGELTLPKQQACLILYRDQARELMSVRPIFQKAAQELWENDGQMISEGDIHA